MQLPRIVMDSNVLVAALRSRRGAAFRLLSLIDQGKFEIALSVALVLEYEDAAKRLIGHRSLTTQIIEAIIDEICEVASLRPIYFLWRPLLREPKDDLVLELAVAAGCDYIVTYNKRDFEGAERFGIKVSTAKEFLREIGGLG